MHHFSKSALESYEFLADALEKSEVATFVLDADFHVLWVNSAVETYFRLDDVELVGRDKRQLIDGHIKTIFRDPARFAAKVLATYDDNTYTESFEAYIPSDGSREARWVEHWSHPIETGRYAGGRIEHYYDITERKEKERALQESEDKFRTLAEESVVGIALFDSDVCHYVNSRLAEMLKYSRDELLNKKSPVELFHVEDRAYVRRNIEQLLTDKGKTSHYRARACPRNRQTINLEIHSASIEYRGRLAVISTIVDITERQRLERELVQIQDHERQRLAQELHDGVASKLTGLTMICNNLTKQLKEGKSIAPGDMEEVTQLLRESVEETRAVSRGLSPVTIDQNGLREALEKLSATTEMSANIPCSVEISVDTSKLDDKIATHLYRIAQEAVNNAIKHGHPESVKLRLTANNEHLELVVHDDGDGLPDPSAIVDGLGFQTMYYRADLIGGMLKIDNPPETGTVVQCVVPNGEIKNGRDL